MIQEKKNNLRQEVRSSRKKHHKTVQQSDINAALISAFLSLEISRTQVIAGYIPVGAELDITELLRVLREEGYQICLPVVLDSSQLLQFRLWSQGTPLIKDSADIPSPGSEATILIPDVLLIPLLAFDEQGNRLGQGMGAYDKTLADLSAQKSILTIGMAYDIQKVSHVPTHPEDFPMDRIITEKQTYDINLQLKIDKEMP